MTLILTPEQHAKLRELHYVFNHLLYMRDVEGNDRVSPAVDAVTEVLDVLDAAEASMTKMTVEAAALEWVSKVDGSVAH